MRKKKQRKKRRLSSLWGVAAGTTVVVALLGCCLLAGYLVYLSVEIDKRFSHRLWDIPSRFFSDTTLLRPGIIITPSLLFDKIMRLGYRVVAGRPRNTGECRMMQNRILLCPRTADASDHAAAAQPVAIVFRQDTIQSIIQDGTQHQIPFLELEPEEITQYVGQDGERRQPVRLQDVSHWFPAAVIAAEDRSFYRHPGVNPLAVLRALAVNLLHGSVRQGGSTITQQLVKNMLLTRQRTISRKIAEACMALMIEQRYSKDRILELYVNEIYLGQQGSLSVNGITEAARFYFGKPPKDLTLAESALIAGLIRAPNAYSPFAAPERCRQRRDSVLQAMRECGFITDEQLRSACAAPLLTAAPDQSRNKAPYFCDYLFEQMKEQCPPDVLSSMGMSVFTTLDTTAQIVAEKALEQGLQKLEQRRSGLIREDRNSRLQGAVLVMDPASGAVRAMVGGRSYRESQFNRITQARRQPGSAFKPFVVAAGLDRFTPATLLYNRARSLNVNGRPWTPRNYEPVDDEALPLRTALARSVNLCAIDLALRIGLPDVVATARMFCFSTPLPPYPSLAIGAAEVVPLELARAYCAFASGGVLPEPLTLRKVVAHDGSIVTRKNISCRRILPPERAYIMNSLLRSVVTVGTARSLADCGISFPAAGKTGTTNEGRDAWFVGYTPETLCLVWVGYDDNSPTGLTGASAALPIWASVMRSLPRDAGRQWYDPPRGIEEVEICAETGSRAVAGCPGRLREVFLAETAPRDPCTRHRSAGAFDAVLRSFKKLWGR